MFQRSGENAWETHSSWSMEVSVYIFCYLCVKCSLNEGHYLTIYCWFSPKGGKRDIPKVWLSRQEKRDLNKFKFFVLCLGFLLGVVDGFCGWKQRKKGREAAKKDLGIGRQGFLPEELCGEDNSPGSQLSPWWPKILQEKPLIPAPCLAPEFLISLCASHGWGCLGSRNGKDHNNGRKNSRRNPAGRKIGFYVDVLC